TCAAISGYDLGGEGDLFEAPRPIVEDSVTAFDPIATAISLLSGYGSSITTYSIERADIESIQNGDLLCEAFYGCEKDLLAKSAYVPAPEAADFVLPVRQSEETTAGERNCFSAEGPLQKSDSTNAFSVGSCLLDVHEVDLAAAFGMTTTYGQGDIQVYMQEELKVRIAYSSEYDAAVSDAGHDQRPIFGKSQGGEEPNRVCRGRDEIITASKVGEKEQRQVLVDKHNSSLMVQRPRPDG
ncbi:hypothetical protein B296_00050357, partial [Ensete ventricosum]